MTCGKTQEFLAKNKVSVTETVDARKGVLDRKKALATVLKGIDTVLSVKGKKIISLDLRQQMPSEADLAAALIGPSGNLRAPAFRRGRTLVAGFESGVYAKVLK